MIQRLLLACLLCMAVTAFNADQYCVYKECSCSGVEVDCSGKNLAQVPTLLPSPTLFSSLYLDTNSITDIPHGSLPSNLTGLFLSSNPITNIADTAFDDSASTLETLSFSSVKFTRIPDAFRSLKVLTTFGINDGHILDWNDDAWTNIGQTLELLDLENVGMTSWPNFLKSFSRLTDITIAGGSISHVPDGALDNAAKTLNSINLFNNSLTVVPKAFSKLTALQSLYLQQNRITDLTWLPSASKLTALSLNHNLISDANLLSNSMQSYGKTLSFLDIKYNRLTAFPNLTYMALIITLDFTYNRISDPFSGDISATVQGIYFSNNFLPAIPQIINSVHSISELYLSYNSVRQIRATDFPSSLQFVDLGFNLITELTDTSFPAKSMITTIRLNNNPIATISGGAFTNLAGLNELYLGGTRLTRLPLALSSLTSLYLLDMTDNSRLVCTCGEKSLESWVMTFSQYSASGNCGLTDIYHFFSELSPSC